MRLTRQGADLLLGSVRDSVTQIGNNTSKSVVTDQLEAVQQREHRDTRTSYQEGQEARECCSNCAKQIQSLLLYYKIVQIARLVFYRPWIPTLHCKMI